MERPNRLEIHHSNRLERLADTLAEVTTDPLDDPFRSELIVVQNPGMARWVAQQIALRTGIGACLDFPLPASFFWQVLKAWLPDAPKSSLFDQDALLWRLFRLLPALCEQPAFAPLRRYLKVDESDLRLFQLARRIADLFDQYLVFRPDLVSAWEGGSEAHWQAILWRALCDEEDNAHRAGLLAELEQAMQRGEPVPGTLPQRVSVFGLTALAPVYVRVLGALARFIPVHVFYLNPSHEYWADLVDDRGQACRRAKARRAGEPDPTGLLDVGNPLLASLGHAGQVFLDQLLELGGNDHDRFELPPGDTLLHRVQNDVLSLTDPRGPALGATPESTPTSTVAADDRSIQVHSVHSPLREIQVLHDRLLQQFEQLDGLEPRDVIVMAPDIDVYAPYIEAVFGAATGAMRLPWSIADRRLGAEQPLLGALQELLVLPRSRFEATEVLSLLEVPAVRRRMGLDETGVDRLRTWIRESGIRWGVDASMRAGLDLPEESGNTWAFGLDRLFLGYALPPDAEAGPYVGVLPYVDIEGSDVALLGVLQSFVDLLDGWRKRLAKPCGLDRWRARFNELLAALFDPDEDEARVVQSVRDRLDAIVSLAVTTGFEGSVSLDVVRTLLDSVFDEPPGAQRFLSGRITFCNMVPMRSIPFRVVCLIGLNGDGFPRSQRPLSFDLMAQTPRRGDRSRRRDDRYLFLEALLSARDTLYLSYVGNDVRDNSVKVPSVMVSELLDYLNQGYVGTDDEGLVEQLLLRHPLQPFSRAYFATGSETADKRLFSYAEPWLKASRTVATSGVPPFAATELGAADPALRTCDSESLIRFLRAPAGYFLKERLGLHLLDEDAHPVDAEPFDATGLDRYQIRQSLLRQLQAGKQTDTILDYLVGEGLMPHGVPGELLLEEQLDIARPFIDRLRLHAAPARDPLEVDLALGGFILQGRLSGLTTSGRLDSRLGKLKAKDRLRAWVHHLVLNCLAPDGIEPGTVLVAEDFTLHLRPVEHPAELLRDLLEARWEGLRGPLPFFPEAALAWIQDGYGSKAFNHAWDGDRNPVPESGDLAVRVAFRGHDPLDERFEATAERILGPMLEHSTTTKAKEDRS